MMRTIVQLVLFIAVPLACGMLGSLFTARSVSTWYASLNKPMFTPPGWIFGPVWTYLYASMGVAAFFVWRKGWDVPGVRLAIIAFAVQLLLNMMWSPAFFGLRSTIAGLAVIVPLLIAIGVCTALFFRVSLPAGWLMTPYLAWVAFATALNMSLYWLNR